MPQPRKPGIALLSDHELFRNVVALRLSEHGLGPVQVFSTKDKLAAAVRRKRIDVAIIDIDHDSEDTYALVLALRSDFPALQVIMMATPPRPAASDLVIDTSDVDRAAAVIGLVPRQSGDEDKTPHKHWSRITERQREVMRWLAVGLDNAAIGQRLHIGERAVKAHVSSLLVLFSMDNRTQLALLADRAGLRPPTKR
jgi:two-component system, NarL family, nitrate/nitrite response regulator NarL